VEIGQIVESLKRRGFYGGAYDIGGVEIQVHTVNEELGEVSRKLRRWKQGVEGLQVDELRHEAVDTLIAAVCLAANACGDDLDAVIESKMRSDEKRGYRHGG